MQIIKNSEKNDPIGETASLLILEVLYFVPRNKESEIQRQRVRGLIGGQLGLIGA